MTTATAHPPTEADIRAAIAAGIERYGFDVQSSDEMYRPFDAIATFSPDSPWVDLRPSEQERFSAMIEAAEHRAMERVHELLVEAAVAAALAFAAEYPDAPRRESGR